MWLLLFIFSASTGGWAFPASSQHLFLGIQIVKYGKCWRQSSTLLALYLWVAYIKSRRSVAGRITSAGTCAPLI
ncbi:hypothetical protein NC653_013133 [Populus alba x Populus x berolinensis]|uniref:Uncharacterized protein n=1 Tax=Populus alba x Populus x berolinensis TaxID=444605 RepID=A0AAD6QU12_9ROSI|nr:hypothetical protein NC653_013133 [Populus alba x Populus x berolinensis]